MSTKRKTRKEYCSIVRSWQKSGMSRTEFCELHHYNSNTFDGWVSKSTSRITTPALKPAPKSKLIVPLQIDPPEVNSVSKSSFEVRYPNGVCMIMSDLPSNEELSRIIHIYTSESCFR